MMAEYVQIGWFRANRGLAGSLVPWFFMPMDEGPPMPDWRPLWALRDDTTTLYTERPLPKGERK